MPNPKLPYLPEAEANRLYAKLNEYNRGRASYKEVGSYLLVLPRAEHESYSLWMFSPLPAKQSILYLHELSSDVYDSLRIASTLFYFSNRCLFMVEYNEKRMTSHGDDIIGFGKYHGHYLHEILKIDPAYLSWVAYKYTPRIPKQERFVQIAQVYHSVHLDIMLRKSKQKQVSECYLGVKGEKVASLTLKVIRTRIEDNAFKTRVVGSVVHFWVQQVVTLTDAMGNMAVIRFVAQTPSQESGRLPAIEHEYCKEEIIHIASARIAGTYEAHGSKYTRLSHVKLS